MSKVTTERRAHRRHPATFELEGGASAEGKLARMQARNLSAGGLYCRSSVGFDEMTRLAVRLLLPSTDGDRPEPVDVEAIVVRRKVIESAVGNERYELALFFRNLGDAQRRRIVEFLASRSL